MNPSTSALLTDLYELTMAQAYLDQRMDGPAVFEFFVRKLPAHRNFLVTAGLEQARHDLLLFDLPLVPVREPREDDPLRAVPRPAETERDRSEVAPELGDLEQRVLDLLEGAFGVGGGRALRPRPCAGRQPASRG